ncbi:MAG: 1-deoxy-D-xylulose-5-phosphate reductoisomerase [Burkholderiales bacterium]|jgi:1-deoxy-D-xylulose-5-phosphate reductoisomerase|nr:1-deoxy-D-xylulose-5-phosphate reductoisomerase [Burkholderiales bacterium]
MRSITLLGATGSIGASTLDVLARHPDRFSLYAVAAGSSVDALVRLCGRFRPRVAVIADEARLPALRQALATAGLPTTARAGAAALSEIACAAECDTVVAAIVGAAGLVPTIAAARAGKRVLLANKEAVVCAGRLLIEAVRAGGGELLPVDSEHSAVHQCLAGARLAERDVRKLILTASGGPFRTRSDFAGITPEQACAHPNWVMGRKISVDSATLMNKGLEVIEASWLFGFAAGRIEVVVHPQSVIHSMVEFVDGSVVAQLGTPDMRTPIAYALSYPERIESGSATLDFTRLGALSFEAPDLRRFRCLALAYEALEGGTARTATLNAANEIAVEAFLGGRLPFADIARVIEETLQTVHANEPESIDEVLEIDARARRTAAQSLQRGRSAAPRIAGR